MIVLDLGFFYFETDYFFRNHAKYKENHAGLLENRAKYKRNHAN